MNEAALDTSSENDRPAHFFQHRFMRRPTYFEGLHRNYKTMIYKGKIIMANNTQTTTYRVTETQRFIAEQALQTLRAEEGVDSETVEVFARMMVLIQEGGMQSYFARGLKWSFCSRGQREPEQVDKERENLLSKVEAFEKLIVEGRGKAACRIRGNRSRLERQREREQTIAAEFERQEIVDEIEGLQEALGDRIRHLQAIADPRFA